MHLFLVVEVVVRSNVVFVAHACRRCLRRRHRHQFSFMHSEIVLYCIVSFSLSMLQKVHNICITISCISIRLYSPLVKNLCSLWWHNDCGLCILSLYLRPSLTLRLDFKLNVWAQLLSWTLIKFSIQWKFAFPPVIEADLTK